MIRCNRNRCGMLSRILALLLVLVLAAPESTAFAAGASAGIDGVAPESMLEINLDGIVTGYKGKEDARYTTLVIPEAVKGIQIVGIGEEALAGSVYLEHVKLPDTLREIGVSAFAYCEALQEITIPGSVATIEMWAFEFCTSLKSVCILYGVQSIGDGAFTDCTSLSTIAIAPSAEELGGDTIFYGNDDVVVQANPDSAAGKYDGVRTTVLPDDSPAAYAYDVDPNTGEVVIQGYFGTSKTPVVPNVINNGTVTEIGEDAFKDRPITQIELPETLKTIGANAFAGTNLTVVDIPSTVTGIGKGAFNDDASVVLKGDSDALDEYLAQTQFTRFEAWGPGRTLYHELTVVSSPALAGTIQQGRSKEYKQGTVIDIEAIPKLTDARRGTYRFTGWTLSTNTTVEGKEDELATLIEAPNFSKTKLTMPTYDITLTANYELVPPEPLIIRNIPNVGGTVLLYTGEVNKTELAIENQWTVDEQTFSVDRIGYVGVYDGRSYNGEVFLDATLTKIYIPMSVEAITSNAFLRASALQEIQVAVKNPSFCSVDGVLFDSEMKTLLAYPANRPGSSYTVPDSVTAIGAYAFYGNRNLKTVDLNNVKTVGNNAFMSASGLTGVVMNDSLTSVGSSAFYGCTALERIALPNSLTSLGSYAFYNCIALREAVLSDSLTSLGSDAFSNCRSLKSIALPGSLTSLGAYAFNGCTSLDTVVWPENCKIKSIPSYAFANCAFTDADLPAGVETISGYAYARCSNLTTINVSATVTSLASNAFYGCNNISAINVAEGNPNYASEDGVLFNAAMTRLMTYPIAKTEEDGLYTVPETVDTIGSGAFAYAKFVLIDLANVKTIESEAFSSAKIQMVDLTRVTSIEARAFTNCYSLVKVAWPAAVTAVPDYAFNNCDSLEVILLPEGVTSIGDSAFYDCQSLSEAYLPTTLTSIGASAFQSCQNLTAADLPAALTEIGNYAFYNCSALTTLTLPDGLKRIGTSAFSYCRGLTEVSIPAGCTSLGSGAFAYCSGLKTVTVGAPSISDSCFQSCTALENLTLQDTVTSIGTSAFASCGKLNTVETGANIGVTAFSNCASLSSLVLKDTVTTIGANAFASCNALTTVEIPKSVTTIGLRAFNACEALESITVAADNANYASDQGSLYNKGLTTLILYPQNKAEASYKTPETVETIGTYAFESANHLTTVTFTENVKHLGHTLFQNSPSIARIYVYNREAVFARTDGYPTQTIFYGLSDNKLSNLVVYGYLGSTAENEVFAHRLKGIKFMALDNASQGLVVRRIVKDASQRTVDNQPLGANTWFGEVVGYQVTPELISQDSARHVVVPSLIDSTTTGIVLQDENGEALTLAEGESIIVSVIGTRALWNPGATSSESGGALDSFVRAITSVTLPQTVTEIKSNAFEDCTALNAFTIPASVQEIRPYAFKNCSALTEIRIPAAVEMLGGSGLFDEASQTKAYVSAFYGCANLKKIEVAEGNRTYADINGVLTNPSKTMIYEVPNGFLGDGGSGEVYTVPDGIETIGDSAFLGCVNLREIRFPATLVHVGIHAFQNVLTKAGSSVTFAYNPDAALDIDNEAFAGCTGLESVTLPANLERLGDDVFKGCTAIRNYYMDAVDDGQLFSAVDGVLYGYVVDDKGVENYALYKYPAGRQDERYEIDSAIPVRQIYKSSFQDNSFLKEIVLSKDVQIIQESAFRNCMSLNSIIWGESTWSIGGMAFSNTALTVVDLPATIKDVGQSAFSNCAGLTRANVYGKNVKFATDVFSGAAAGFTLYGYQGSTAQDYAQANGLGFALLDGYRIAVSDGIANGVVSADKTAAHELETVTVTVVPAEGYQLVAGSLKYNGTVVEGLSFSMPAADVVITAEFEPVAEKEVTLPDSGSAPITEDAGSSSVAGSETPEVEAPASEKSEPSGEF